MFAVIMLPVSLSMTVVSAILSLTADVLGFVVVAGLGLGLVLGMAWYFDKI
jgi:hypothetical protein